MSKLLKQYNELKEKDPNTIYMFKVGIFYIFINDDARLVSKEIGLKLTNLSSEIIKCGFPIAKLEKYTHLLERIQSIDLNNTTCKEAFDILYNIQQKLKNIQ